MGYPEPRRGLPGGQYMPLSESNVRTIADTAVRVLEEVGVEASNDEALELFQKAGAAVDRHERLVKIPRGMVEDSVARAPSTIRLCGRDPKHDLEVGGKRVYFGTGGTALYVLNGETEECREAALEDLRRIVRLVDALDNVHFLVIPVYPNDIEQKDVDVNRFYTSLANTTKHVMGGVYTDDGLRRVIEMAQIVAGSPDALRERPIISIITCVISPLRLDPHYTDFMLYCNRVGIPVACPSEPLCGATSPVTLAANLVVQAADTLAAVVLAQIAKPGAPVMFACVGSNTDFRDMKNLSGSIELGLINAGAAQVAQYFELPYYATAGMSDAKVLDAQCGYESALTSLMTGLAGANFIHDAVGLMEFTLTVSPEKYVIDNEIIGMVMRAVEGIKVNDETLAFDLIKQAGPGGNFLTEEHTVRHMRSEHYIAQLSDRDRRAEWESKGRVNTVRRASDKVREILATHQPLPIAPGARDRILETIPGIAASGHH